MKLRDVNPSKRTAKIWFSGGHGKSKHEEKDLILESLDLLIKKKKKIMDKTQINRDAVEKDMLQKYEMDKKAIGEMEVEHTYHKIDRDTDLDEPEEYNLASKAMIYDMATALNEHIKILRRDGTWNQKNHQKFLKLRELLHQVQQQKSMFERVRPMPKGWGRLRR